MKTTREGGLVLSGCLLLMLILGSVHAFSIFLQPIEKDFGASRTEASLTYSIALASLTLLVFFGHRIYPRLSPARLALLASTLAAGGAVLAAVTPSVAGIWLGYGVLFGGANGLGYGFCLQYAAQANPRFRGGAIGLVTAAYGLGAAVAPWPIHALIQVHGLAGGMLGLAAALLAAGPLVAALFAASGLQFISARPGRSARSGLGLGALLLLWIAYGSAVASGLMAIGHATGIAAAAGLGTAAIVAAPAVIATTNVAGSLLGGLSVDLMGPRRPLVLMTCLAAATLAAMALLGGGALVLGGLGVIGFAYGLTIAAFPAAIANSVGAVAGIRVYGQVFTAWGTAGLLAPVVAGQLFERHGGYAEALLMAAALSLIALAISARFPA